MTDSKTRLELATTILGAAPGAVAFICEPNSKRPLVGYSWFTRSTDDPAQLAEWFAMTQDANWGFHPGPDYVVIDLDKKPGADGVTAFRKLCEEQGIEDYVLELDTLMVGTPSGGLHIYFKAPWPCSNGNGFPDGIDVRGCQGYVVGAGSTINDADYEVIDPDAPVAELPEFLLPYLRKMGERAKNADVPLIDELDQPEDIDRATEWLKDREPAVQGANGDDWTFETICYLRDFGLSEEMALQALNDSGWNGCCDPPWCDGELRGKISNSYRYAQNRPGCKAPSYRVERLTSARPEGGWAHKLTDDQISELFHPTGHLTLAVDNTEGNAARQLDPEDDEIPEDVDDDELSLITDESTEPAPVFRDFLDFVPMPAVREYVIRHWLIAHGITHLIAKRGTGKSTVALDMGLHIACDMDWCNTPTQKGWKVVYLCLEDDAGFRLNARAWTQHHGVQPDRGRFCVTSDMIKLTDPTQLRKRLRELIDWADGAPCVVILDTWQRATSGWSKNDQEHMERAVDRAESVARHLRGPMLTCVHPPKNGPLTVVGSGVQEDTSTGILSLERVPDGVRLKVDRMKGPGEGAYMAFELRQIVLEGEDSFGKPLTGLVAVKIGGAEEGDKIEAARNNPDLAKFNALATACLGVIEDEAASAKRAGREPRAAWYLYDVAAELASVELELPGGGVYRLPTSSQRVAEKIVKVFETPRRFDGGKVLALTDTGDKMGGKPVRRFQLTVSEE